MRRMARSLSVACVLAGASAARADGVSALVSPGVAASRTEHVDASGNFTAQDTTDLTQQYQLSLDRRLYPNLGFSGTGLLAKDLRWTRDATGATGRTDQTAATLSTRLAGGDSLLGGALSYDRRQEAVALPTGRAWATGDTYALTAGWHPLDLPTLDLRLERSDRHDPSQPGEDATTWDGLLALEYRPGRTTDLRYTLRADRVARAGTETTSIVQDGRGTWRDTVLGGRTTAFASAGVTSVWSETTSTDPAGTVATQRFPVQGLFKIESFADTPERDTLEPLDALKDGNVQGDTGVNLGWSVGLADRNPRDLGLRFADAVTKVNRLRVWVKDPLEPAVWGAFLFDVYRSEDGQTWAPVPLAGPISFGTLENRFELPILETAAPYLKVVTRPIDPSVSTADRYKNIVVTELQAFDAVPAAQVRGASTRVAETFSGSAQTRLLSTPNLSHDVTVSVTNGGAGAPVTWLLVNGLSLSRPLSPHTLFSARVARQDADAGDGHQGMFQWSGSLAHQPLPTVSDGVTYSGQLVQSRHGVALSNALSGYARAEFYKGLAGTGNAALALSNNADGTIARTVSGTVGASVVPNRVLSLGGTYGLSDTATTGGGHPATSFLRHRLDGTVALSPVPALYATAGVTRVFGDGTPTTLAHLGLNLSPFPQGQLLVRFTYTDSLDTAAASRSRLWSPSLRWTPRPGLFLDLAYTDLRTGSPIEATRIQTASANLTLTL